MRFAIICSAMNGVCTAFINIYVGVINLLYLQQPPGRYLTPIHQIGNIVAWWYTCRNDIWLFFFLKIKKNYKRTKVFECVSVLYLITHKQALMWKNWFVVLNNMLPASHIKKQGLYYNYNLGNIRSKVLGCRKCIICLSVRRVWSF